MATEGARVNAENAARKRAYDSAITLQKKAEALSFATTLRIEGHMKDMKTVEDRFIKLKLAEELKEINAAKAEAEVIQAEAKARARVAGEAAVLQSANMARA